MASQEVAEEPITIQTTYMRYRKDAERVSRVFESKRFTNNPAICLACGERLNGKETILLALGPGPDPDDQDRARMGRWYDAKAVELHATCAGVK